MHRIFEHYKKTGYLHHAHIIEGSHGEVIPLLVDALAEHLNIVAQGNPDVTIEQYESLGIEESRHLKEIQSRGSFAPVVHGQIGRKIFIIGTDSFTREAQNALLKTFEEPTEGSHFFIIVPRVDVIIATLRSRVVLASSNTIDTKDEAVGFAKKFIEGTLPERFALAKKITDTKDRALAYRILSELERMLYTELAGELKAHPVFQEIYQTKTYLGDRGSSVKMLLENLAISMPQKKA